MTRKEVLKQIEEDYGTRGEWISDISKKYNAPYEIVRQIIVALGYYRGRRISSVSLDDLLNDNFVRSCLDKYFV